MRINRLRHVAVSLTLAIATALAASGWTQTRREIKIPDVPGYQVLKFDLHMHTVFSDGNVWPTVRVKEAWCEGLDGISITDHIEYLPHRDDVAPNFNRPYEIARPEADRLGLMLFRGAEITRSMPPGHLNAIFLEDVDQLKVEKWEDAVRAAFEQKAFIFWNHPGWKGQQPDGVARWYDEHTLLLEKGWLHGIEMVNEDEYYPEAHRWALEHNLAMLGNSDVHEPIAMAYAALEGKRRPIDLILAKEKTPEAVKEALFAGRTVVYWRNFLMGKAEYLAPIFEQSISMEDPSAKIAPKGRVNFQIHNASEIDYELELAGPVEQFDAPKSLTLAADRTVLLSVQSQNAEAKGKVRLEIPYVVKNLKIAPDAGLPVTLKMTVEFIEKK